MGPRILVISALLAALAGCGGSDQAADRRGPTTTSSVIASGTAPADCSKLPDFVALYADARVETCVSGPGEAGRESGTIVYTVAVPPATIVDWSKARAAASGMPVTLSTTTLLSVRASDGRSLMTLVETVGGATKVTLNWGRNT